MKENGYSLLATAIIRMALVEEGWSYLKSPSGRFYMDIADKKPVDFIEVFERIKTTERYKTCVEGKKRCTGKELNKKMADLKAKLWKNKKILKLPKKSYRQKMLNHGFNPECNLFRQYQKMVPDKWARYFTLSDVEKYEQGLKILKLEDLT